MFARSPTSPTSRATRTSSRLGGRRALRAARRARPPPPRAAPRRRRRRAVELRGAARRAARSTTSAAGGLRGRPPDRRRGADARAATGPPIPAQARRGDPGDETALEEIYYFEVAGGGVGYQRVYMAGREIDMRAEVRSGDIVLLPPATTARRWPRRATTSTTST